MLFAAKEGNAVRERYGPANDNFLVHYALSGRK